MTKDKFTDLTRKAMIREYILLCENTKKIVENANAVFNHIETKYKYDSRLQFLLDEFDGVVDNSRL